MATNPYYSGYDNTNEQDLTDSLIIEAIQMKGMDVKYLPRTHTDYNYLYGESPNSAFKSATEIEMYVASVDGFGEGEMFSKFGLVVRDTATFIVSKTRFKEEFPEMFRPNEGDLIFMPYTNAILEIKFVNHESPFFQQGKQYVYELKLETFEFSHEDISTGDPIDDILNEIYPDNPATETSAYGDNADISATVEPDTSFDPANPFRGL